MKRVSYLPPADAVSTFTAAILLAYALAHYIRLPLETMIFQFAGVVIPVPVTMETLTGLLVAGLVAGGMDTLLRTHPIHPKGHTLIHWLLPFLSAWVLGMTLNLLYDSPYWWAGVFVSGVILTLVCLAEYVTMWPEDRLYSWASAGLSLLAAGLYLALAITMHSAGVRLFWRIPALTIAAALAGMRTLHLRLDGRRVVRETYSAALLSAQSAAFLQYLKLSPAQYGLLLLAPLYALLAWFGARNEHTARPWLEAVLTGGLLIIAAIWL